MIFQYSFLIDTPVEVPPKYRYIFHQAVVPFSRVKFKFDSRRIGIERDVQEFLKIAGKAVRAKLSVFSLDGEK